MGNRTVLRLPRQDYYRKSLTSFRGCWCGCYDPSARLRCFPRLEKHDFDCSLYFTGPRCALGCTCVLGSFDSILRLGHNHSCFMSHTHFDFVEATVVVALLQGWPGSEVSSLDPEIFDWNPEILEVEPGCSSLYHEIFDWNPEAIGEPGGPGVPWEPEIFAFAGTVLRLPRQDYYRKSLTSFRGCWCGCYDPSATLHCFPRLEKHDFDCSLYFTGPRCALGCTWVLGLARIGGLWRPDPARMPL
ncbi:hypothetical protein DY000_02052853 [Brassica cretica]|uniref:Aminotransferase-like plant mobile domain-containing protein n=1 Tax=Brassica cretica TaxID=69181 RepID=A0ABQ7AHQ8_BRACR|nr:hypothetical protein DY000_02052853 [Brassica cretica]